MLATELNLYDELVTSLWAYFLRFFMFAYFDFEFFLFGTISFSMTFFESKESLKCFIRASNIISYMPSAVSVTERSNMFVFEALSIIFRPLVIYSSTLALRSSKFGFFEQKLKSERRDWLFCRVSVELSVFLVDKLVFYLSKIEELSLISIIDWRVCTAG